MMRGQPKAKTGWRKPGQTEIVLLFTAFIAATYGFGIYLFPAIVESIRAEIDFSYAQLGVVSGLSQAGFLVSSLLAGFLTLRLGAVNIVLGSIILCALSLGWLVVAGSFRGLALPLVILGVCASSVWVPMVEVARAMIATRHRGKALGLMSSGTSYGVFINSGLLAFILPVYGWRALWVATAAGVAMLAVYAALRLWGIRSEVEEESAADAKPEGKGKTATASAMKNIPRKPAALILLMMVFNGFSYLPFQTYLSAYLIGEMGLGDGLAASVWGGIGLTGMFSGFLMGGIADRITIRRGMILTYTLLIAAAISLMAGSALGGPAIWFAALAFGLSFYPVFGLVPAYISHLFGKGQAALVFAFGSAALGLGGIAGNLAGGFIKDNIGSFDWLYLMVAGAVSVSIIIAILLPSDADAGKEA